MSPSRCHSCTDNTLLYDTLHPPRMLTYTVSHNTIIQYQLKVAPALSMPSNSSERLLKVRKISEVGKGTWKKRTMRDLSCCTTEHSNRAQQQSTAFVVTNMSMAPRSDQRSLHIKRSCFEGGGKGKVGVTVGVTVGTGTRWATVEAEIIIVPRRGVAS